VSPRNSATRRQAYNREKTPEQMPIVTAAHRKSEKKFQPRDIKQIQDVINKDYEDKLKAVNDEAQEKLRRVQKEHQKVLAEQ
jgi:hypothetical protein